MRPNAPSNDRRQTAFRCDKALLKKFQLRLKESDMEMSPVIEGWITEYMSGDRTLPAVPISTEGQCPVCESDLRATPEGLTLVKVGPIEPMAPGEIPDELAPLVRSFLQYYVHDKIFADTVNGIIELQRRAR